MKPYGFQTMASHKLNRVTKTDEWVGPD